MNTVYVCFSRNAGVLSRLIRWATGANISHAFLLYRSEELGGWVTLGASAGGWVVMPAEHFLSGSNHVENCLEVGASLRQGIAANRQWLGAPYGLRELIGMAWVVFMRRVFGKQVPNPINYAEGWFCSEIVDKVLCDSGIDLGIAENTVTPVDLRRLLASTVRVVEHDFPAVLETSRATELR